VIQGFLQRGVSQGQRTKKGVDFLKEKQELRKTWVFFFFTYDEDLVRGFFGESGVDLPFWEGGFCDFWGFGDSRLRAEMVGEERRKGDNFSGAFLTLSMKDGLF